MKKLHRCQDYNTCISWPLYLGIPALIVKASLTLTLTARSKGMVYLNTYVHL